MARRPAGKCLDPTTFPVDRLRGSKSLRDGTCSSDPRFCLSRSEANG